MKEAPTDYRTAVWSRGKILKYADEANALARKQGWLTANIFQALAVLMDRAGIEEITVPNVDLGARRFNVIVECDPAVGDVTFRRIPRG